MNIPFTYEFGRAFVPKRLRPNLRKYLLKAGINNEPYSFFGLMFYLCFGFSLFIYLVYILPLLQDVSPMLSGLVAFITIVLLTFALVGITVLAIYFFLDIKIYQRTKQLEEVLPHFFEVLSSNLKGGLPFDKAMWGAIKPEFGILANEIGIAAKKVMTGHDIENALMEFSDKYDSPMLKRSIDLLVGELQEGGSVAPIIDKIIENFEKTKELKEEISASVLGYVIFISIVVMVIAPALFSLSKGLFEIIKSVVNVLATSLGSSDNPIGMDITEIKLDKEIFDTFSHVSLLIIAFFASLIVSIIERGNIKGGLKYIPLYIVSSQLLYLVLSKIIGSVFGGIA
ncbi:MAG: type II secretion system F family protein [Candidatus Nanoarchaeia archaeon]